MVSTPSKPLPPASLHTAGHAQERATARLVNSAELMRGERELIIMHAGERYRLQHTRNGKLILTK